MSFFLGDSDDSSNDSDNISNVISDNSTTDDCIGYNRSDDDCGDEDDNDDNNGFLGYINPGYIAGNFEEEDDDENNDDVIDDEAARTSGISLNNIDKPLNVECFNETLEALNQSVSAGKHNDTCETINKIDGTVNTINSNTDETNRYHNHQQNIYLKPKNSKIINGNSLRTSKSTTFCEALVDESDSSQYYSHRRRSNSYDSDINHKNNISDDICENVPIGDGFCANANNHDAAIVTQINNLMFDDFTLVEAEQPSKPSSRLKCNFSSNNILKRAVPGTWMYHKINTSSPVLATKLLTSNLDVQSLELAYLDPISERDSDLYLVSLNTNNEQI